MHTLTRSQSRFQGIAFGLCVAALAAAPAFAMGGGSSSSGARGSSAGSGKPSDPSATSQTEEQDMTTCPKGKVWNIKRKACIRMRSDVLPDDALADYAYALAKADRYAEAIDVLNLLHDQNTAEALNYRGYATRKLGRTDEGISYYLRSIALAPRYAQVREYLGEAYVIKGRVDLAKEQLATVRTLCGTGCEPYRELSEAIAKAPNI
jgi:tetratricopeptide (TPR) repeat protein